MTTRLLVIGYGNELRCDDGVGPWVARRVAAWERAGLQALAVHQLLPELAEVLVGAERVVFVDAGPTAEEATALSRLEPEGVAVRLGHASSPRELLALTQTLYGKQPEAWLLAISAPDLAFGEGLSAAASCGMDEALRHIERLWSQLV